MQWNACNFSFFNILCIVEYDKSYSRAIIRILVSGFCSKARIILSVFCKFLAACPLLVFIWEDTTRFTQSSVLKYGGSQRMSLLMDITLEYLRAQFWVLNFSTSLLMIFQNLRRHTWQYMQMILQYILLSESKLTYYASETYWPLSNSLEIERWRSILRKRRPYSLLVKELPLNHW